MDGSNVRPLGDECENGGDPAASQGPETPEVPCVVELGSGTGLAGLMVAKAVRCRVEITDLPELMGIMEKNVRRNFRPEAIFVASRGDAAGASGAGTTIDGNNGDEDGDNIDNVFRASKYPGQKASLGTVRARVLRWGVRSDYWEGSGDPYDIVMGADVVASLYDPVALARTIHALCSTERTRVYLSYKGRLTGPHEAFEGEMRCLFRTVERMRPRGSRNRNPGVWILRAGDKIDAPS